MGHGLSSEVSLAVPPGTLDFWGQRLESYGVALDPVESRFGERVLPFADPHGLRVALVESESAMRRAFEPWDGSPIGVAQQIRGLEGARMLERELSATTQFLTKVLGFSLVREERGWHRYGVHDGSSGCYVDLQEASQSHRGAWGVGSIHHIAWRVEDESHQDALRARIDAAGRRPTPTIDRFWFKSVYFLEPGGVLFELATEGPGFAVDEDPEHLGEALVLPPWLEQQRTAISAALPSLSLPAPAARPTLAD
jgi:glyoxalase family protein